jgi:hypothetical protein
MKSARPVGRGGFATRAEFWAPALVALCAVLVGVDSFRLGFFADDFLFLDMVRRMPAGEVLLGQHGVWPWYRPLSRELYFWLAVAAEPWGLALVRIVSIACFATAAVLVLRLGARLGSLAVGVAGALLFSTNSLSKFLVSWASGFQDLLAVTLMLGAVLAHSRGQDGRAALLAFLAPFAKETGFLAVGLVLGWAILIEGKRRYEPWMGRLALAAAGALLIHVAVRLTWRDVAGTAAERGPPGASLARALLGLLSSFVSIGMPRHPWVWVAGALVGAVAWWLLAVPARRSGGRPKGASLAFLGTGVLLGLMPAATVSVVNLDPPNAHFLFPALPWVCLLAGAAVASFGAVSIPALAAVVAINTWGIGYRPPDLDSESGWKNVPLGWTEGQRMWGRTERLARDLREALAQRPESVVVLYLDLPSGTWLQTEDGPATREILRDRTARGFFLSQAPREIQPERVAVLGYDPVRSHHLELVPRDERVLLRSVNAMVQGRARAAYHWSRYAEPTGSARLFAPYAQAAAVLAEDGVEAFARVLGQAGLLDSIAMVRPLSSLAGTKEEVLAPSLAIALQRPLTAAAHLECADRLEREGAGALAELELFIATRLAPSDAAGHALLGLALARRGFEQPARLELSRAAELGTPPALVVPVRQALEALAPSLSDPSDGGTTR